MRSFFYGLGGSRDAAFFCFLQWQGALCDFPLQGALCYFFLEKKVTKNSRLPQSLRVRSLAGAQVAELLAGRIS
jgi:hypothetical protein